MSRVSATELASLWRELGVRSGMTVMCHSFLPGLGVGGQNTGLVVDTILDAVGSNGTFVVPTFTYSYFRDEVYDVGESPSSVGALGDLIRKREAADRSLDPNFSFAAIGSNSYALMQRETPYSFGSGSIYEKLTGADVQVLLLGVDFTALALFMHLEKINEVDYRYDKKFHGITRVNGAEHGDVAIHFVRDERRNPVSYRQRIGSLIDMEVDCRKLSYGYRHHRFVPASTVGKVVKTALKKDPYFLIKEPV